jgi:hypothetical protein
MCAACAHARESPRHLHHPAPLSVPHPPPPPPSVENIHYMRRCLDQVQAASRGLPETVDPLSVRPRRLASDTVSSGDSVHGQESVADGSTYGAAGWTSAADRPADTMSAAVWGKVSGFLSGIGVMSGATTPSPAPAPAVPPSPARIATAPASAALASTAGTGTGHAGSAAGTAGGGGTVGAADAGPGTGGPTQLQPRVVTIDFDLHGDDSEWVSAASTGGTDWLRQGALVLAAVVRVVTCVDREGVSVLVHCSDGWDRTAQASVASSYGAHPFPQFRAPGTPFICIHWRALYHHHTRRSRACCLVWRHTVPIRLV